MEEIHNKQIQIEQLRQELEIDKKEINNVPERFLDTIKSRIEEKESLIKKIESEVQILIEGSLSLRLSNIKKDFEHAINDFIDFYPYKYPKDKELFINSVSIIPIGGKLGVKIKGFEEDKQSQGYYNKNLVVRFSNGTEIKEHKITDTFILTIMELGVEKVKELNLKYLGTPLITNIKSDKYQQRLIDDSGYYILTSFSKEKKREILETIGKKLKIPLTAEFK